MKIKILLFLVLINSFGFSKNIDLLWRARGLQALHTIDSLQKVLTERKVNLELYDTLRCQLYIEKAYSLYANYDSLYRLLRFNDYYHILNTSFNDSLTNSPLDVGYIYKNDLITLTIFSLPRTWLAMYVDGGIIFKPWKSKIMIYYSIDDPLDVKVFGIR